VADLKVRTVVVEAEKGVLSEHRQQNLEAIIKKKREEMRVNI
jgi:hypothetical protein